MGEISFWYRPTRVVPDQRPLNGRCMIWQRGYYLHSVVVFSYRRLILTRWVAVVSQWYCVEVAFLGSLLYSVIFVIPRLKGKGSPVIAKDCRGGGPVLISTF